MFLTLVRVETLPNVVLMPAMLIISAFARAAARASESSMPVSRSRIIVSMNFILAESPGRIFSAGLILHFCGFQALVISGCSEIYSLRAWFILVW